MSTRFSTHCRWRNCHLRRLYSSSETETTQQQSRRAPIALDFGGVLIGCTFDVRHLQKLSNRSSSMLAPNSRSSRRPHRAEPLDIREFKQGSLSQTLAWREIKQRQQNNQSKDVTAGDLPSIKTAENISSSYQQGSLYVRSRPPQQRQRNNNVGHQNQQHFPRHNKGMSSPRQRRRGRRDVVELTDDEDRIQLSREGEEESLAIEDDVDATKTSFRLRRADPPIVPPGPPLPPSLTILDQNIYIDAPTRKLQERTGGNYSRYFSSDEWKLARAQSSAPLGVVDYASLILHLNGTVPFSQRGEGMEVVKKYAEKAEAIATGS